MDESKKFIYIGAAVAGLAVAYMIYRSSKAVGDIVADAAQAINPLNDENIINQGATGLYQWGTGSEGTPGTDFWEATHGGALDATSDHNALYNLANSGWQAIGVIDEKDSIGTAAYGLVEKIKSLF